jgi:hypothetical protein
MRQPRRLASGHRSAWRLAGMYAWLRGNGLRRSAQRAGRFRRTGTSAPSTVVTSCGAAWSSGQAWLANWVCEQAQPVQVGLCDISVYFMAGCHLSLLLTGWHEMAGSCYLSTMRELRQTVTIEDLADPDLPLMLRFAVAVEEGLPNATATDQEFESNPLYENDPQGPSMRPWRTQTDGGRDVNTDFAAD